VTGPRSLRELGGGAMFAHVVGNLVGASELEAIRTSQLTTCVILRPHLYAIPRLQRSRQRRRTCVLCVCVCVFVCVWCMYMYMCGVCFDCL
jgi:hypothetical protein